MLTPQAEDLILQQAIREGLLKQGDLTADLKDAPSDSPLRMHWGVRVAALIQSGRLDEAQLRRLGVALQSTVHSLSDALSIEARSAALDATQDDTSASSGGPMPQLPSGQLAFAPTLGSNDQHAPSTSMTGLLPHWDKYEILSLAGRGGMGEVYKARDRRLGRQVALKFIHGENPITVQRFLQEARAQARLEHPNICKVYEVGFVEKKPYIAMDFIDGASLDKASAVLSLQEKVQVLRDVAFAMHMAHEQGVVHRDLKPSNIMIERLPSGQLRPVVMDFGLARDSGSERSHGLTESGAVIGTPAYMSPEQARGEARRLDRRSDVYSLGATLYDVLTGRPPFEDETVVNVILKVISEAPRPLRSQNQELPEALELIVSKCMNKEAEQRYQTAQALGQDLDRFLSEQKVTARRLGIIYRMRYFARRNKTLSALAVALCLSILGLGAFGIYTRVVNLQKERAAKQQAELRQRLGQEITAMEWMLRSARQLPLHDLGREKVIVRERMAQLQSEMTSHGDIGRQLSRYAIGRGHMALHEYPEALVELEQSMRAGNQSADLHYALGVVLGKHFERAMYEARLSGGGDWAAKQLKELEPKYLTPAIASLSRSRAMKSDASSYLEALIAFYQRNYDNALVQAEAAIRKAPWLYEAHKLSGDVHLERALQARDSGRYEVAEKEFAAAVQSFSEATTIGQSDAEVYEGLAEVWVRQVETALLRGQQVGAAYAAALAASDKIMIAEPQSVAGPLKQAFATMMTMATGGSGLSTQEGVARCLKATSAVLKMQPRHPYASDVAANCHSMAAEVARGRGENPEPHWQSALQRLGPVVERYPRFLWGLNDMGQIFQNNGAYLRLTGKAQAKAYIDKSVAYYESAKSLDETYLYAYQNLLGSLGDVVMLSNTEKDLQAALQKADEIFSGCKKINIAAQQCYNNYFQIYARAAARLYLFGQDPQAALSRAVENIAALRKLGGSFLDAEQYDGLVRLVDAASRVRKGQDPAPALAELQGALQRCFALAAQDAMCRTLAAQADWVSADWLALRKQSPLASLASALAKVTLATASTEIYPDAWQVRAATHLRLARAQVERPAVRDQALAAGRTAVEKVFATNPNHALGRATLGAILLLQAEGQEPKAERAQTAQAATAELARAIQLDPFLQPEYTPLLRRASELGAAGLVTAAPR